jgi:RND superfamily putative drug exporter
MLERWVRGVLRHRSLVLCCWLVVVAAGVVATFRLPALLANSFAVPGTDSDRARAILSEHFGDRPDGAFTVVFDVEHPSNRATRAAAERRLARAARAVPTGRAGELRSGGGVLWGQVETTLDLPHAKRYTHAVRRALAVGGGAPAYVTGQPAIQRDLDPVFARDLRRGEAIALPVALIALLVVLGWSLAVSVPFLFAAGTIGGTLALLWPVAHAIPVVSYVTNLVELIGIGLAIDYSLLVVHRFREELGGEGSVEDAVVRTAATAGRAIVFSGLTVAIGLALLVFVPVPFVRSMGVGGALVALVAVTASLTLQPALLAAFGRRVLRRGQLPAPASATGFWSKLAETIMRRPVAFLLAGTAVLVAAAVPTAFLDLTPTSVTGIPSSLESARGYELLRRSVGAGAALPIEVAVDSGVPGGARRGPARRAISRLADEFFHDPEVLLVASGHEPPYVDATGRYARIVVAARHDYGSTQAQRLVRRARSTLIPHARFPESARVHVGGPPAQGVDFLSRSYGAFVWLVPLVLVLTYLLLVRAFRSLLLPLKAVILNVLAVAAAYGLLVVAFPWGVGAHTLGLYRMDQIEGWVPIFLFATLFGLSMDYEVFMVSRMREAWDRTHDNRRAVAEGLERTGRIVTAAAVVMIAAFSGFVAGRVAALQEFGLGLAVAILLDATIVRIILVPASMAILGRWNWWLPERVARLVRVAPSRPGR